MTVLNLTKKDSPNKSQELETCFKQVVEEFNASKAMVRLATGTFTLDHYKEYLRQVYYYSRESTQLLAFAATRLRGSDRALVSGFLKHGSEEFGHDQWALRDLENLGADISKVPYENPLPETLALTAFTFYQIEYMNPIAHLGYVYFLEFLPTSGGDFYMKKLESIGVPQNAMSFLAEHITIDANHNKLMDRYINELIHDEADMDAVKYSMRVTGRLYANMLQAAIEEADKGTAGWGKSYGELARKQGDGLISYEP